MTDTIMINENPIITVFANLSEIFKSFRFNYDWLVLCVVGTGLLFFLSHYLITLQKNNKKRLLAKGLSEEYIMKKKRLSFSIISWITVTSFVSQILMIVVYFSIQGNITLEDYGFVFLMHAVLVYVAELVLKYMHREKIRELVLLKKADIVVDFNYTILNIILKPGLEYVIIAATVYLSIGYLTEKGLFIFAAVLFSSIVPTLYHFSLKIGKYYTRESFAHQYTILTIATIIIQPIRLVNVAVFAEVLANFSAFDLGIGAILAALLAAQFIRSCVNYPKLRKALLLHSNANVKPSAA